jgi:TonB-dependent starch-binding outer membrane protein SusC
MKIKNRLPSQCIKLIEKIKLFTPILLFFTVVGYGQQRTVTGTVLDDSNSPIPGVIVNVVGTKTRTYTDFDGKFKISLSGRDEILEFSFLGFTNQIIDMTGKSTITVKMSGGDVGLQEIVVVGYGTQKKGNLTGSLETVKFDGAVNTPVTNASQLLYGEFSGVQLTQGSGLAGNDASTIVIRGVGTFGSTNPLIVIDNVQYEGLTEFNNLAPSDIASITVLKDASAGAIYGARASNGVILITTKKGKAGTSSIDFNTFTGFQLVTVTPNYLASADYAKLREEYDINQFGPTAPIRYTPENIQAIKDGADPDRFANTNWAKEILRTAPITNHYLSFSGGNEKSNYRFSLGYVNQEAIVKGKFESERFNLGLNISSDVKKWLTVSNVLTSYWETFKGPTGGAGAISGETGIINQFQRSSPTIPVYYSNGEYGIVDGAWRNQQNTSFRSDNPIRRGFLGDFSSNNINISDRLGLNFKIAKRLTFETSGSLILTVANSSDFNPRNEIRDYDGVLVGAPIASSNNTLRNTSNFNYRLLNENIFRYETSFNKVHNFSALLGHSAMYDRNDGFTGSLQNFPTDLLQEFNAGGITNPEVTGGASESTLQSFFSRVNYGYNDKYLAELNVRYDGTSNVRGENPEVDYYTLFPSASLGWVASKESFLKNVTWLSNLKFRGSWGLTGNDGGDGANNLIQNLNGGLDYILGTPGTTVGGVALTSLANPLLRWEKIEQYNIAMDLGLFKNKLTVSAEYYSRTSKDILYTNFPIPASIGVTSIAARNSATMVNKGLELTINYRKQLGDFKFSAGAFVTRNLGNEVTGLGNGGEETISGNNIIRIGEVFRSYFGYKTLGVFQTIDEVNAAPVQFGSTRTAPGDLKYEDISGPQGVPDNKIDAFDRQIIGNPVPEWIYNFNAKASYKWVDFSILFQGVQGIDRFLFDNGQRGFPDARNNALSYWINRWTPENPSTTLPRLGGFNNSVVSDFFIEDASYIRIKNLEIGFSVPEDVLAKYGLQKVRIYFAGQNLVTITDFKNFDPERAGTGSSDLSVPLYKIYSLGLNLKF